MKKKKKIKKLIAENNWLRQQVDELIERPNSLVSAGIRFSHKHKKQMERILWSGSVNT